MLSYDLVLNAINEVLRLKEISHDYVRVTHHFASHPFDSVIELGSVAVDFVRDKAVHHLGNACLLVKHSSHDI